jgi:hypothetical protein
MESNYQISSLPHDRNPDSIIGIIRNAMSRLPANQI